jgi:NADH-quinone oxidoreductase chain G
MITVTINDRKITLKEPATVLEAAKMHGIEIPHFCDHELLEKFGGCRMCLVEVEKVPKLQPSCILTATDGMVVRTESPEIARARKAMLEFLLINHPLECPRCDKAGECALQDYTLIYGPAAGRFEEKKFKEPESVEDPLIVRNMERCIMCTRCVRMCEGVQGASAISVVGRGKHSFIEPFSGGGFDCDYCGGCVMVCPVGSLMSRLHRYHYRPWETEREVKTICPYCGVGCTVLVQVRQESIQRVTTPGFGTGVNQGILCVRGFFGYEFTGNRERLTAPLIRKGGGLKPATWDRALGLVAERFMDIKRKHGGGAIAGIASARCMNEENYLFQKLMRTAFNTNNIDSIARLGVAGARAFLDGLLGGGSTANPISGIAASGAVLVTGGDPTHINPVLGVRVRNAFRAGAKVVTLGYTPGLGMHRSTAVTPLPRTEGIALAGLLAAVLKKRGLPGENPELESTISSIKLPSASELEQVCGINDIQRAAEELACSPPVSIVAGSELFARPDGGRNLLVLAALSYILGAKLYLMSEKPNENGLMDMGCVPDMLPGELPVRISRYRRQFEEAWGVPVSMNPGKTLMEFMEGAGKGYIKAMYVMGENPAFNLPDSGLAKDALGGLEFLVVQDIFMSETAELAHVVLPAMCWPEKDGTYTNLERRTQTLKRAVKGKGMEDWKILAEVGRRAGLDMPYGSAEDIMAEIARVSPLHRGLTYDEIEAGAGIWPHKAPPAEDEREAPDVAGLCEKAPMPEHDKIHLLHDKPLYLSGTLSRRSPALNSIYPAPTAKVSEATAAEYSLGEGDTVEVSSSRRKLALPLEIEKDMPDRAVLLTNNFDGAGIMSLLGYNIEPLTRAPVLISVNAYIQKVGA